MNGRFPVCLAPERRFWHTGPMVHRRLVLLIAIAAAFAASGCRRYDNNPTNDVAAAPARKPVVPLPAPEPKLDRQLLIVDTLQVLTAAALGTNDADAQKELNGREFEIRLRFGCPGLPDDASRGWSYDEDKHVLRASISADLSAPKVPASDLLLQGYEGVAGFTIDRPLLLSTGCPSGEFGAMNESQPVIAVAQLFTSEDSRVQRPEQKYAITKALEPSAKPTQGLDLVIAGRLNGLKDGRVIHCAGAAGPPACIVSAKFDRVAIENPVDGSVLGEWSQW